MTANEAWELMRELPKMNRDDLEEVYGTRDPWNVLIGYSPEDALKELDDWKSRKKIQIGDEVEFYDTTNNLHRAMYVTSRFTDGDYCGICTNGDTYCVHKSNLTKTGRHIDFDKFKALIKPRTIGDSIRAMSDEELGVFFGNITEELDDCKYCPIFHNGENKKICMGRCIDNFSDWLKQPVERSLE